MTGGARAKAAENPIDCSLPVELDVVVVSANVSYIFHAEVIVELRLHVGGIRPPIQW